MFVTNWISTTKIQKISEITNFFRHYFLSRTEVIKCTDKGKSSNAFHRGMDAEIARYQYEYQGCRHPNGRTNIIA